MYSTPYSARSVYDIYCISIFGIPPKKKVHTLLFEVQDIPSGQHGSLASSLNNNKLKTVLQVDKEMPSFKSFSYDNGILKNNERIKVKYNNPA